jgi:Fe-S-cluster containining protein
MFDQLRHLHAFVDQTIASVADKHPDAVHCRPGCADCCHAAFDLSFIEAVYLANFLKNHPDILASQQELAGEAAAAYETMIREQNDPATVRIRCPLLAENNLCLAHEARPINCRTYGTPTLINGITHVCGLSGFINNQAYPTVDLAPLQKSLNQYSVTLVGDNFGNRRYPIAWIFLKTDFFLPK